MKFIPLTLEICERLKKDGYSFLAIKNVYDDGHDYDARSTVILKALKRKPEQYLVDLSTDDVSSLLDNKEKNFCIMLREALPSAQE